MSKPLAYSLLAGLISAGLFIVVMGLGLGFFFMFLPSLPLLLTGLSKTPRTALHATLIGGGIIILIAGLPAAILFLLLLGLPSWYIAVRAMLWREDANGERQWFPIGLIFTPLVFYACLVMAAIIMHYAGQEGGVGQALTEQLRSEIGEMEGDVGAALGILADQWAFLVFSLTVWLWGLALYAHVWIAHRLLARKNKVVRPGVGITVFPMPDWMLALLALSALASLIGSPTTQLLGKFFLVSLLLPYFLLGAAHMHAVSVSWPSRRFFLFFAYFLVALQFWPALFIAGIGIWQHIKRLSGRPHSSKSGPL